MGTLSKTIFPSLRLGYLVLPYPLVKLFTAAKYLADRHTPTLTQEVLTDVIREGHFERHLRRARARNAVRRSALLSALSDNFGERVSIEGANAGLNVLSWFRDVSARKLDILIGRAAQAGIGIYSVAPYYLRPPKTAGLLLGYGAMTEDDIRAGIQRLADVFQ